MLEADNVDLVGGYKNQGSMSTTPDTGYLPVPDPFAGIPTPPVGSCDYTDLEFDDGYHLLMPGTYCGGIQISGKADVEFASGTYVMAGGNLHTSGNFASLSGDEVTVYTSGDSTIQITGKGEMDLTAPQSGNYAGMLFFGDPDAPSPA